MKALTAAEMREVDRLTTERHEITGTTLMEHAGKAVSEFVLHEIALRFKYPFRKTVADPDAARAGREVRGEQQRVAREAVGREVLLGEPDLVEAERLGELGARELLGDDTRGVLAGRALEDVVGPEAHARGYWQRPAASDKGRRHGDTSDPLRHPDRPAERPVGRDARPLAEGRCLGLRLALELRSLLS